MSINYDGKDVRLLIKSSSNEEDPLGIYRIVKFNTLKNSAVSNGLNLSLPF